MANKYVIIILIFLFSYGFESKAWIFGGPGCQSGNKIVRCADGNLVVVGFNDGDGIILKVDTLGNLIWSNTFGVDTVNDPFYFISERPNGGFVATGEYYTNSPIIFSPAYIYNFNSSGDTTQRSVSSYSSSGSTLIEPCYLNAIGDNEYIYVGNYYTAQPDSGYFIRIDSSFAVYDTLFRTGLIGTIAFNDSEYVMTSLPIIAPLSFIRYNLRNQQVYSSTLFNSSISSAYRFNSILPFRKEYILGGSTTFNGSQPGSEFCYIQKVDSQGSVVWTKYFYESIGLSEVKKLIPFTDSTFFIIGTVSDSGSSFVSLCDTSGSILWTNFINTFYINDGILDVNRLILTGSADDLYNCFDVWIGSIDAYGVLINSLTSSGDFQINESIIVFPNPSSTNTWRVSIPKGFNGYTVEVVSSLGQIMLREESHIYKIYEDINIDLLPTGIFTINLKGDNKVYSCKAIKAN
jgi:hypothetical protein